MALRGCFVHVELWCSWLCVVRWLVCSPEAAVRQTWIRGSHITGGNCHQRMRCISQAAVWARSMWEEGQPEGQQQGARQLRNRRVGRGRQGVRRKRGWGDKWSMGLGMLRKQRNETASRAAENQYLSPGCDQGTGGSLFSVWRSGQKSSGQASRTQWGGENRQNVSAISLEKLG